MDSPYLIINQLLDAFKETNFSLSFQFFNCITMKPTFVNWSKLMKD